MNLDADFCNFTLGEISPRMKGRTDYKGYFNSLATCQNMVPMPQGGVTRRPGTLYSDNSKDQTCVPGTMRVRLQGFIFSTLQAYMLEFGAGYIRVKKNDAPIVNVQAVSGAVSAGGLIKLTIGSTVGIYTGNTMAVSGVLGTTEANGTWIVTVVDPTHVTLQGSAFVHTYVSGGSTSTAVEIPTSYVAADIPSLKFTQSDDLLYIFGGQCPTGNGYQTQTLTRSSHTDWTIAPLAVNDGPYLPQNATATTLAFGSTSGSVAVTASSATGINGGQGFLATDVGRMIRFKGTALWGWLIITAWTDSTHVQATVQPAVNNGAAGILDSASAAATWRLGKWSNTTGWPYTGTFWQQRLMLCGTNNQPNAIEGSVTGDFTNLAPTAADGTVADVNALSWLIDDDQVNATLWLSTAGAAQLAQLAIGTSSGETIMQGYSQTQALSPTNVQVYRETLLGSVPNITPVRILKSLLFVDRSGRKVYDWQFQWTVNGYIGFDRTVDAEHITQSGMVQLAYQQGPHSIIWGIRNDGTLVGFTYLLAQQIMAWHRHQLGGEWYGSAPVVESIATIPAPDGTYDELWLSVLRTINGVPTRFIEVMSRWFDAMPLEQAIFLDAAISTTHVLPSATLTPGAASGKGVTFTASSGTPFSLGDVGQFIRVNGGVAKIQTYTSSTVVIGDYYRNATSTQPAISGNWSMDPENTVLSGLNYLNGETVGCIGDGADFGEQVPAGGSIVLAAPGATYATVGLPYDEATQALVNPYAPEQATASINGRIKQIDHMYLRMFESVGGNFGMQKTDPLTAVVTLDMLPIQSRNAANPIGQPPSLFSGIQRLAVNAGYDQEGQMNFTPDGPMPLTILAVGTAGSAGRA